MIKKIYNKIKRNRDSSGRILTYTTNFKGIPLEFNTLKEARVMARIIEPPDLKEHKRKLKEHKRFLRSLK